MEIKRCPFCGGNAETTGSIFKIGNDIHTAHSVVCDACGASSGGYEKKKEAIEKWNKRFKQEELNG